MPAGYSYPAGHLKLPRRGHFFAARSAKKRRNLIKTYQIKYHSAADCLIKDRMRYWRSTTFAAEHWKYLRTTNPLKAPLRSSGAARSEERFAIGRANQRPVDQCRHHRHR